MRFLGAIRRLSLTQRLLALTLAASLPGLIALAYNTADLRQTRYQEVRSEALRNAQFIVSELTQIFDGIESVLYAISQAAELGDDVQKCTDYIVRARGAVDQLTAIIVVNVDGTVRCYSETPLALPNLSDRSYFQDALRTRKFTVGTYVTSRVSNRSVVPLALPIIKGESLDGLVLAGLNLDWLGKHLVERGVARGNALTIADRHGVIVSREPLPDVFVGTKVRDDFHRLLFSSQPGVEEVRGRDQIDRILGYVPAALTPFGLYVSAGISRDEAFAQIDRAVRTSLILLVLGGAGALTLAWLVGERLLRQPLMRVVGAAEAWQRGDATARTAIAADRRDEIGLLGHTFDRLLDDNARREVERDAAEAQREILVHELAHRVKNTLATVQSMASLSFRHSQGPEALQSFQDRLQALVRGHELLTKKNWERANLDEITKAAIAPLRAERGDRFSYSGPPVEMPATTAVPVAMILHELCTNAVKYGALSSDTGHVDISWTVTPHDGGNAVNLTWRESGGPTIETPQREGFGSQLIANLTRQMRGSVATEFAPTGLVCKIELVAPN